MKPYHDYLKNILDHGVKKDDRTHTGTLSYFGAQLRFDLSKGFPLVTTKRLHVKSIVYELLWFLKGDTNTNYLNTHGVSIWNEWADAQGELGPVYGKQWRDWVGSDGQHHDQITRLIEQIKQDPNSRRMLVSAWNVGELDQMALMPCHTMFQFYVANGRLSCQLYQRSADSFLGVPFNIASYALLVHMVAHQTDLEVGDFIWTGGDCHIYANHMEQVTEQLSREIKPLPNLTIRRKPASIFEYEFNDFEFNNYDPHAAIKAPVAK